MHNLAKRGRNLSTITTLAARTRQNEAQLQSSKAVCLISMMPNSRNSPALRATPATTMGDDYRSQLNAVGWALSSVAIVVVGARVYCRYFLTNNFGLDDGLMVLALVRCCPWGSKFNLTTLRLPGSP